MCWLEKKIGEVAGKKWSYVLGGSKVFERCWGLNKLLINKVIIGGLIYDSIDRPSPQPPPPLTPQLKLRFDTLCHARSPPPPPQ